MSTAEILNFAIALAVHPTGGILFAIIVGTACALVASATR